MSEESEYERGRREGGIDAILAEHTRHLAEINVLLKDFVEKMGTLTQAVQTLADREQGRKEAREQSWITPSRILTVIAVLVAVASLALAYYQAARHP